MKFAGWRVLAMALALGAGSSAFAAEGGVWLVSKSSGEVWTTTTGAQPASLGQDAVLKPGDTIRTGRNGRVLLTRGEETILVSPNSVIGLPTEAKDGLATTILQQAGSILLDVEKRNVKHFEVETPYLAAVVKGTNFRVTVNATSTSVGVLRGQVEVADFKSGQIAQVMPGQMATAFAKGKSGLSLSGAGTFSPIEQGKPRATSIERIIVPKTGLDAPRNAARQSVHTLGHAASTPSSQQNTDNHPSRPRVTRISAALGEVRLDFHKVTHGLAHGSISSSGSTRNASKKDSVWSSPQAGVTTGNEAGSTGAATSTSAAASSGVASQVAAATASASNSGNGNSGNGNSGNGNNGNGHGNANGNGNGNGNNGNGNGNGNGHGH